MDCQKGQHESLCSRIIGNHPSCSEVVLDLESTVSKGMGHQRGRVWPPLEEVRLLVEAVRQTNIMKSLDIVLLCPEIQVSMPRTPMQVGQYEPSAIDSDAQALRHSAILERVKFPHITPDEEKVTHKGQLNLIRHLLRSHASSRHVAVQVDRIKSDNWEEWSSQVASNKTLQSFSLRAGLSSSLLLRTPGCHTFCDSLSGHKGTIRLDFTGCRLGDKGARVMSEKPLTEDTPSRALLIIDSCRDYTVLKHTAPQTT